MFSQLFSKKLQKSAFFFVLGLFGENIWWVWGRIRGFAVSIDNESEKSTVALLFIFFSVNCSLSVRRIKETTNIIITLRRGRSALPLS